MNKSHIYELLFLGSTNTLEGGRRRRRRGRLCSEPMLWLSMHAYVQARHAISLRKLCCMCSRALNIHQRRVARAERHGERDMLEEKHKQKMRRGGKCEWSCDYVHDSLLFPYAGMNSQNKYTLYNKSEKVTKQSRLRPALRTKSQEPRNRAKTKTLTAKSQEPRNRAKTKTLTRMDRTAVTTLISQTTQVRSLIWTRWKMTSSVGAIAVLTENLTNDHVP